MNYGHAKKKVRYTAQKKLWQQLWIVRLLIMEPCKKRTRSSNSSQSDIDFSLCPSLSSTKKEKSSKQQKKKLKKMTKKMEKSIEECSTFSEKIDEINSKLNNILTKEDTGFIKTLIKDTLEEMKEKIISSVMLRVEKLEAEMHDTAVENTTLKEKLTSYEKENAKLKCDIKQEINDRKEKMNDLEQYGRRNNVRITGISYDKENETAYETTDGVLRLLNEKLDMNVGYQDIDIAHRLGKYKNNAKRAVIVKFVHRHVKASVMREARKLKNTNINFIYILLERIMSSENIYAFFCFLYLYVLY